MVTDGGVMTESEYSVGFGRAAGDATVAKVLDDARRGLVVCGREMEGVLGFRGVTGRL